ncbi:MAG: CsbD family protein [Desulfuromonadaceae bacterium]
MKSGNRDKTEGLLHEIKGKFKKVTGKLMHKPEMEDEGTAENATGKLQGKAGSVKKGLGE